MKTLNTQKPTLASVPFIAVNSNQASNDLRPGMGVIGYGYNIFGEYLSASSTLKKVAANLDETGQTVTINNESYDYPPESVLEISTYNHQYSRMVSGESYEELIVNIDASMGLSGSYGLFSGTLNAEYTSSTQGTVDMMYEIINTAAPRFCLKLQSPTLDSATQEVLDSLDTTDTTAVKAFFDTYGTHVVTGILLGGACSYAMHANRTSSYQYTDFKSDADVAYGFVSGQASYSTSTETAMKHAKSDTSLSITGGDTSLIQAGEAQSFNDWISSINNAVEVISFSDTHALTPYWELCSDPAQGTALHDQFVVLFGHDSVRRDVSDTEQVTSGNIHTQTQYNWKLPNNTQTDEIIVGFAGSVDSSTKHFSEIALQFLNLETNVRHWDSFDPDFNKKETGVSVDGYQRSVCAPDGCAMTGLAMTGNHSLTRLCLYYQTIELTNADNFYLGTEVGCKNALGNTGSSWDVDINPSHLTDSRYIISGVGAYCSSSLNEVSSLTLFRQRLVS